MTTSIKKVVTVEAVLANSLGFELPIILKEGDPIIPALYATITAAQLGNEHGLNINSGAKVLVDGKEIVIVTRSNEVVFLFNQVEFAYEPHLGLTDLLTPFGYVLPDINWNQEMLELNGRKWYVCEDYNRTVSGNPDSGDYDIIVVSDDGVFVGVERTFADKNVTSSVFDHHKFWDPADIESDQEIKNLLEALG